MHYRHIGAHPEDTAEGAVLAPGESTEGLTFDPESHHNKRLIDEGVFALIPDDKPEKPEKKKEETD